MKRTELKRGRPRRLTAKERSEAWAFKRAALNEFCAVCGPHSSIISPIDAHHVVSAQELRRRGLPVYDPRNALPVHRECHERHENASHRIPLAALTEDNLAYVHEVLREVADYYLARHYGASEEQAA